MLEGVEVRRVTKSIYVLGISSSVLNIGYYYNILQLTIEQISKKYGNSKQSMRFLSLGEDQRKLKTARMIYK